MFQQRMKLHQITTIAIGLACLIFIIAIIKHWLLPVFISILLIAVSIICEGLLCHLSFKKQESLRLISTGVLILVITIYLLFYFSKLKL